MASGGGVEVPVPPKRPTVIRPSKQPDEDGTSSRPAPPVPGRPAPAIPPRTNDAGPSRPQPPVPERQEDQQKSQGPPVGRPPPPVPGRPEDVNQKKQNGQKVSCQPPVPPAPSNKPTGRNGSVKMRPEITIVSARPMSEVGFRKQDSPAVTTNTESDSNQTKVSVPPRPKFQPPRPEPLIQFDDESPNTSDSNDTVKALDRSPPRGPPPPIPPSSRPKVGAPPVVPPAAPKRPTPSQRDGISPVPTKRNIDEPPPVPKHPAADTSEPETAVKKVNPKVGVPLPPVPRNPPVPGRPPPAVRQTLNSEDVSPDHSKSDTTTGEVKELNNDSEDKTSDKNSAESDNTYAVINKPKRPTIIRPGRPSVKSDKVEDSVKPSEPPALPPRISPTPMDSEDNSPTNSADTPSKDSAPEFLKLKLKSTVQENPVSAETNKTSATNTPTAVKAKPVGPSLTAVGVSDTHPPNVLPKPKPTVLPKPKIAAKPNIAAKPVVAKPVESKPEVTEKKVPSEVNKPVDIESPDKPDEKTESSLPKRPESFKRPTIIRPGRPSHWGSSENVRKETKADDSEKLDLNHKASMDDVVIRSRPQPPLPSRRPVSMSNIPQALAQEAALSQRTPSSQSVKSTFSSSESLGAPSVQPKISPRPAARSRPISMAAGDGVGAGNPTPSVSQRLQNVAQKVLPDLPTVAASTVAAEKSELEPHRPPPPKPSRNVLDIPKTSEKISSSSEDDDFVMAQSKPDRPKAGPPRPTQRHSVAAPELKKPPPPRPGGIPSPRKMSNPEEPEKDPVAEMEAVKMRPARPGSKPSRPVSMPLKAVLPSKPKLPKSKSGKGKGLPALPARPGPGHPAYHHMMCVPHGQALFDYTARHQDELSFKQGETIVLVRTVDAEWVVGKIDETEGMFPRGFVKVLMPLPGEQADVESSDENEEFYDASPEKPDLIGHGPRCRARFDYEGESHEDLAFEEGDFIKLLSRVGMEWRRGEINGRVGIFPLGFVEVIEDLPPDGGDFSSTVVTALFDFDGQHGELSFMSGEKIHVKYCVNEEWLFGEIDNRRGQFPTQFIDHVPPNLPPLPQEAKTESSPLQSNLAASGSQDKLVDALSQWDTVEKPEEQVHKSLSIKTEGARGMREEPYCVALHDYPAQTADDLGFSEGDKIEIVERISDDWLKGKLNGNVGMFPVSFVDVKVDIEGTTKPTQSNDSPDGIATVALYDFQGEAANELTFHAGDQLIVQELVEGADDWRWGLLGGKRGMFPAAFVHVER